MARNNKDEWARKVFALIQAGNLQAAMAQVRVAPTAADVARLQALLPGLTDTPAHRQLAQFVEEERALLAAPRLHRAP